jgi:RNA polymerase sigma factor (sigma-70 family)
MSRPHPQPTSPHLRVVTDDGVDPTPHLLAHRSLLHAFFRRRLGSPQDAEDHVQELYLRVLASAESKNVSNWRGFLLRAASNLVTDAFRRGAARQAGRHVGVEEAERIADLRSPERIVAVREEIEIVRAALAELDPVRREAYLLARFDGLSQKAIAAQLGIEPVTVGRHIERVGIILARKLAAAHR